MVVVVVVSTRGYRDHSDLDVRSYRWLSWRIAWLSLLYESDIVPITIAIVERTMMANVVVVLVIGGERQWRRRRRRRRRMTHRTNVPWS